MLKDLLRVLKGELSTKEMLIQAAAIGMVERHNMELQDANLRLIATIREMDQHLWTMSQQPSWERMRPHFNKLQEGMEKRKQIENDRIRTLMVGEIQEAYNTPATNPKYLQGPSS